MDFMVEAKGYLVPEFPSEIVCRISVSRAYYGAYHAALGYADSISIPPVSDTGGKTHEKLRLYYQGNLHPDNALRMKHRKVGYCLKQIHDNRVLADYRLKLTVDKSMAELQLRQCDVVVESVNALSSAKVA